eukprot:GILJ01005277.1.p1 GENE.GILJ01005277.1~~GILJ01005277.1.p1  ORF type:complete len:587 (-),score=111.41 GILJ01005277.1:154-1866(-)
MSNLPHSTEELLLQIGRDLRRSEADIRPIITRLVDECWYDTVDSLREISDERWSQLKVPQRVVDRIKASIGGSASPSSLGPAQAMPAVSASAVTSATSGKRRAEENEASSNEALVRLRKNTSDQSFVEAVKTLVSVVNNVLVHPDDEAKRTLRKTNPVLQRKLGEFDGAFDLLRANGFRDVGDQLVLDRKDLDRVRLEETQTYLLQALEEMGVSAPLLTSSSGFNPYASRIVSVNPDFKLNPQGAGLRKLEEQIKTKQKEIEQSYEVDLTPVHMDRCIRAVRLLEGQSLESALRVVAKEREEEAEDDEQDAAALMRDTIMKQQKMNEERDRFRSRTKKQLQQLNNLKTYEKTTIRVSFPDRVVLEAVFLPREPLSTLYSVVRESLADPSIPFYLFQRPPVVRLTRMESSLYNEGLVPAAVVYFGTEYVKPAAASTEPFIKQSLLPPVVEQPPVPLAESSPHPTPTTTASTNAVPDAGSEPTSEPTDMDISPIPSTQTTSSSPTPTTGTATVTAPAPAVARVPAPVASVAPVVRGPVQRLGGAPASGHASTAAAQAALSRLMGKPMSKTSK